MALLGHTTKNPAKVLFIFWVPISPAGIMLNAKIGKVGKVLVCGMKGVGKTALIEQLVYGHVNPETVRMPLAELKVKLMSHIPEFIAGTASNH